MDPYSPPLADLNNNFQTDLTEDSELEDRECKDTSNLEGDSFMGEELFRNDKLAVLGLVLFLMLAISWNVRGLGRCEKKKKVRCLVKTYNLVMVFIQESKIVNFNYGIIRSLEGTVLSKGVRVDADGRAGGLILLWNDKLI
ncbi:hypothetical protein LWI28_015990 [Acer negundo]|uniref:Transmembrane protein n=1 Tax=Acer negundo TaxID=4023 RepID=A0AAD5NNG4_ACENE|nr:hypothetical protein LWI28_015990 [Acer negundo]